MQGVNSGCLVQDRFHVDSLSAESGESNAETSFSPNSAANKIRQQLGWDLVIENEFQHGA
jgi:hypothetical protein